MSQKGLMQVGGGGRFCCPSSLSCYHLNHVNMDVTKENLLAVDFPLSHGLCLKWLPMERKSKWLQLKPQAKLLISNYNVYTCQTFCTIFFHEMSKAAICKVCQFGRLALLGNAGKVIAADANSRLLIFPTPYSHKIW